MKKVVNISLDIETLSCRENAAIISIAAVPFNKRGQGQFIIDRPFDCLGIADKKTGTRDPFYEVVNATTCALAGMHFEQDTVKFWSEQNDLAKAEFSTRTALSIRDVMESFVNYIVAIKEELDVDVCIWCQGTDFDVPIVRNAIRTVLQIKNGPWGHTQVRCARTWILEVVERLHGQLEDPYTVLPHYENWNRHSALSDAMRLAYNVANVNRMLDERLGLVSDVDAPTNE